MPIKLSAAIAAVGLCLIVAGVASAVESNVYWQADLHQGTSIIAYGRGTTEAAAVQDCHRLQATTRAMTAAETRRNAVSAVTAATVRWCNNPRRYATVSPDPPPAPVNCAVSAWSAWQPSSWGACLTGEQSRLETRTRTITTQPANGGTTCPALTETRTVTQNCTTLAWTPPTQNTNGTTLTNLAGYRVSYGTSESALTQTVQLNNAGLSAYTISGLAPGTYYFAVRAYTNGGTESANSNVVSKVVQ